ncbi:Creatine kinase M-type [Seminavis robusta]|uniref:Creatine kinase M-type n=1 Tax=Seminavis robusta TaxID=568900 RepID=A0A9N8EPE9_9STRA|nr:Creatine kinase M-type [Seminavis robusta]|eukprot:Sro1531_g280200.1 Creatine kinase M-type (692) ;mRNA; f:20567-22642
MMMLQHMHLFTFLASTMAQRIGIKILIDNGVYDFVLLNLIIFFGMLLASLTFKEARAVLWECLKNPQPLVGNARMHPAACFLVISETIGGVLLVVTLYYLSVSAQSIFSRGTELVGVVMLEHILATNLRHQLALHHMVTVVMVLLLGSFFLPLVANRSDLSTNFSAVGIVLVMIRSLLMALQTVCEHISLHNYAFPPGVILLIEAAGGMALTLTLVLPLSILWDPSGTLTAITDSLRVIAEEYWLLGIACSMIFICGYSNWARLNVIDRLSAFASALVSALLPGCVFVVSLVLYYSFGVGAHGAVVIGEPFDLYPSLWMIGCFSVTLLGNVLYYVWMPRMSQLYLEGLKRVSLGDEDRELSNRLDKICASGKQYQRSAIGCYALDESDYDPHGPVFPLFRYVVEQYHETSLEESTDVESPFDPKRHHLPTREECGKLFPGQDVEDWSHVVSLRVRVARNISGFAFVPSIDSSTRRAIATKVRKALTVDTGWVFEDYADRCDLWPVREFRVMRAAGILEDWPTDRFVATKMYNKNVVVTVLVNEEDHLRIVVTVNDPTSLEDVSSAIAALSKTEEMLQENLGLSYSHNPVFGFLASCPTNVGTGFKISIRTYGKQINQASEVRLNKTVQEIVCEHLSIARESSLVGKDGSSEPLYSPGLDYTEDTTDSGTNSNGQQKEFDGVSFFPLSKLAG